MNIFMNYSQSSMPEVANYLKKTISVAKLPLSHVKALPHMFREVAMQIADLTGTWNPVEIFTPDNVKIEKAKFIEAFNTTKAYNPQFTYTYAKCLQFEESKKTLLELGHQVKSFTPRTQIERLARVALHFKIKDDLATCVLVEGIQNVDEAKIGEALRQKYPGVDHALLEIARENFMSWSSGSKIARNKQQALLTQQELRFLQNKEFGAEEIKEAFVWALEQYGILKQDNKTGFSVRINGEVTAIDVRDKSEHGPTIFIPEGSKTNGINLVKLIGHEIDGHARQSVNGERLFFIGGGSLKIDDETLYEGLAKRYDDFLSLKLFGNDAGVPLPYYTYAVHAAETGKSFCEIFDEQYNMRLQTFFNSSLSDNLPTLTAIEEKTINDVINKAWSTTYRVMRGHLDTANSYSFAMAKDLAYLRGFIIDKQLVENKVGYLNECAIIASGGLQILAEIFLEEDCIPLPYQDIATVYCTKLLNAK